MIDATKTHELADVIALIYEAAVFPERWEAALEAIRGHLGGFSSMFSVSYLASGRGEVIASDNFDYERLRTWEARHGMSPWVVGALSMQVGEVKAGHTVLPVAALRETSLYRELCEPQGILDILGIVTARTPHVLGAISFYDGELFDEAAVRRLEALAPHLVRATAVRNRVSWLSQRAAAFENSVERLPVGIVLVGSAGEVLHANSVARALLEARDGVRVDAGRLVSTDPTAQKRYQDALARVLGGHPELAVPLQVPRTSGLRPLQLLASPSHDRAEPWSSAAALVWIHDPEETPVPSSAALEQLFGLSPAESRMAASLSSGATVHEYAADAGVSEETARFRLKQVMAKMGVHRQADLVRMVLSSLPGLL
jgi:DNA-binding CsgD family transcriptional regulator